MSWFLKVRACVSTWVQWVVFYLKFFTCLLTYQIVTVFFLNLFDLCLLSWFSCVWLFATLWTVAHQGPLSLEFSRQEYWRGLPFHSPGDLPDPGMEPKSLTLPSPALAGGFFTNSTTWIKELKNLGSNSEVLSSFGGYKNGFYILYSPRSLILITGKI